jgi:Ni/Co efflux regulator RcnB
MNKLLSVIVAALFAVGSASAFAASHAGAQMKDEKKTEKKKAAPKGDMKKAEKKKAAPKKDGEMKKGAEKKKAAPKKDEMKK